MANSIYWGQGANMNTIYYGQGANNDIGWGSIHAVSWSPETDLVGLAGYASTGFTIRVLSDEGTFEALQCLQSNLISFNI